MAQKYQTRITKARFVVSPLTAPLMAEVGNTTILSVFARWDRGIGVSGSPAPPLAPGYASRKVLAGGQPLRDLNRSGRLRRSIQVVSGRENAVEIGPVDGVHTRIKRGGSLSFDQVLARNNSRYRMWGVGPLDAEAARRMIAELRPVRAVEVR